MKAYKVIWKTLALDGQFLINNGYEVVSKEKFFGSKDAAELFARKKDDAARELGLFPSPLITSILEVDLE